MTIVNPQENRDVPASELDTAAWDTEDWAAYNGHPSENNHYVSVTNSVTFECPVCGYTGTAAHPRRLAPTHSAPLHYVCPDAECDTTMQ